MPRFHLISINCRFSHSCLAQFYLRNELEQHLPGCETVLSQLTINDPYYRTLQRISELEADALFFSVYIWNHDLVCRLVTDLARLLPELPLVLGGPQVESLPPDLPGRCCRVLGEIEGVGYRFYRDLAAGSLKQQYRAQPAADFPSPYRSADFSEALQNRQLYYESSRGCPFSCSYCLSSISRGVRHKPLDQVRQELAALIAARPMIIKFVDRTFNDNRERALAIWRFLRDHGGGVKCHFEIAPDRFDEEMFAQLDTLACDRFQFEIGIQSCNPQTLAAVNRSMDLERAGENIRRLAAMDTIHIHVDLILGLPHETAQSFRRSFNRVFSYQPHYLQLGLLKVLPGTTMAARVREYGLVHCARPPYEVLATRWLDHAELHRLYGLCECVESFYNTRFFRSLWHYLRSTGEEPFVFFSDLLDRCEDQGFFELARTQKLMNEILVRHVQARPDGPLLLDLLRYDWLRCGHRRLPRVLETADQRVLRDELRRSLPQNLEGVFDYRTRVEFLKQATFLAPLPEALQVLEPDHNGPAVIAFLPEQEGGVMKFSKTVILGQ